MTVCSVSIHKSQAILNYPSLPSAFDMQQLEEYYNVEQKILKHETRVEVIVRPMLSSVLKSTACCECSGFGPLVLLISVELF